MFHTVLNTVFYLPGDEFPSTVFVAFSRVLVAFCRFSMFDCRRVAPSTLYFKLTRKLLSIGLCFYSRNAWSHAHGLLSDWTISQVILIGKTCDHGPARLKTHNSNSYCIIIIYIMSRLYKCPVRDSWELRIFPIGNWEFPFFPVVCVRNHWMTPGDDTKECQYILVHKIQLQLKLYHCNTLLSTYIQQNNQKVKKNKTNLPIRLLFWLVTSLSPFSMCFSKPRISKWDFPDRGLLQAQTVFPIGKLGISVIPTTLKHHISLV